MSGFTGKKQRIGVIGIKSGVGCTLLANKIANYLASVEKREVLFIEIAEYSRLLPVVRGNIKPIGRAISYQYQRVQYVVSASIDEAYRMMQVYEGFVVIDFGILCEHTLDLFCECNMKIVMGSAMPWDEAYYESLKNLLMKGKVDTGQTKYFCFLLEEKQKRNLYKKFHILVEKLPVVSSPFLIVEKDIVTIKQILYGSCAKG